MLTGFGMMLLPLAALLFFTAESITMYTPYSTTTGWSISSDGDRFYYYAIAMPSQVMVSLGCALCGILLLAIAIFLRTSKLSWLRDDAQ